MLPLIPGTEKRGLLYRALCQMGADGKGTRRANKPQKADKPIFLCADVKRGTQGHKESQEQREKEALRRFLPSWGTCRGFYAATIKPGTKRKRGFVGGSVDGFSMDQARHQEQRAERGEPGNGSGYPLGGIIQQHTRTDKEPGESHRQE